MADFDLQENGQQLFFLLTSRFIHLPHLYKKNTYQIFEAIKGLFT